METTNPTHFQLYIQIMHYADIVPEVTWAEVLLYRKSRAEVLLYCKSPLLYY